MMALWRVTKPQRPLRKAGNAVTTKWVTIFSFAGVGIEADAKESWAHDLTDAEVATATLHGCRSEQGFPDWIDHLMEARPNIAVPIVVKEILREWKSTRDSGSTFLAHYANTAVPTLRELRDPLIRRLFNSTPGSVSAFDSGLRLLENLLTSKHQRSRISNWAIKQFNRNVTADSREFALRYLALLFLCAPESGLDHMTTWINSKKGKKRKELAAVVFAALFNREDRGLASRALALASPDTLLQLVLLSLKHIRPTDDQWHQGVFTPDLRDRAQSARGYVLSALIDNRGESAYRHVIKLASLSSMNDRAICLLNKARSMTERDAEEAAWSEEQFLTFARDFTRPVRSALDLHHVILETLRDIDFDLKKSDASSQPLLAIYGERDKDDENALQHWLAEQLRQRASGRYHVSRETEVAERNQPDIVASGTNGLFEVAIEVKPADAYGVKKLISALDDQLAEQYLKPTSRRHGVLVLFDFGRKGWRDPDLNQKLSFDSVVALLKERAKANNQNNSGPICLAVAPIAVNAAPLAKGRRQASEA